MITLILFIMSGCNKAKVTTGDEKKAEDYVKAEGYKITAYMGEIQKYILDKNMLFGPASMQYQQIWSVQNYEPDQYFGKEIITYGFTVENHPLQKRDNNGKNGVNVYIMMIDGEVIGGYSFPNADVAGAYSSLDGKTLEEVTGLSFQRWSEEWEKKSGID
ncbi:hypothetical protein ACPWSR_03230 [Alloiococcus sp. CFN-8]|uniref:hypothetical protein n=1 Tax=Alloiococcus sp. CFN-8 TaxID=3416081 RepID=UPI003CFB2C23